MGNYYETFEPPFYPRTDSARDPLVINARGYERNVAEIIHAISDRIAGLYGIDTSGVKIASDDRVVTLTGVVASDRVAQFLGAIAANTLGVREVHNELRTERAGARSS